MVFKIHDSASSCSSPLEYNTDKVGVDAASVLYLQHMDGDTLPDIRATFERYELKNRRTDKVAFHMSVNPGEDDLTTEADTLKLIREAMQEMGYGEQPYVVFRHDDTGRTHYHVVSVKTDENGKKIEDHFQKKNLNRFLLANEKKYGYKVGNPDREALSYVKEFAGIPFRLETGRVADQLKADFKACLNYEFETPGQLSMLLERYNIGCRITGSDEQNDKDLVLWGLDADGVRCTREMDKESFGVNLSGYMDDAVIDASKRLKSHSTSAKKIAEMLHRELKRSRSEEGFLSAVEGKGLQMKLSRTPDGNLFGYTVIDHNGKVCYKGSDIDRMSKGGFSLSQIEAHIATGGWDGEPEREKAYTPAAEQDAMTDLLNMFLYFPSSKSRGIRRSRNSEGEDRIGHIKKL